MESLLHTGILKKKKYWVHELSVELLYAGNRENLLSLGHFVNAAYCN